MRKLLILALTGAMLIPTASPAQPPDKSSVTEVFHLRNECADLGKKILDKITESAPYRDQRSHYNTTTNRCYVEVVLDNTGNKVAPYDIKDTLYDAQTNEMLAEIKIVQGEMSGKIYDDQHNVTTSNNSGWDDNGWNDATAYINQMMADERKK